MTGIGDTITKGDKDIEPKLEMQLSVRRAFQTALSVHGPELRVLKEAIMLEQNT